VNKHLLVNAKAYASLLGSVLTAVSTTFHSPILTAAIAVCSAVAVWTVPNASE
jgi:hypothetical protein